MKKIIIVLFLLTSLFLHSKTWVREYTYQASEADSKITSRSIALEQVKRLLLQEIGVYVHSTVLSGEFEASGEVKDLSAKQIEIISAGITETKILEETWNGETYYIKAEITADENDVINRLDKVINDKEKTKQLEDSRQKTEEALSEIESLKQQLAKTKDENEKLQIQNKYNKNSNQLTVQDLYQKGLNAFERNQYEEGINIFERILELDDVDIKEIDFIFILHTLARFYQSNGEDKNKAIRYYQQIISINPIEYLGTYIDLALLYSDLDEYNLAIQTLQKAIAIDSEFYYAYMFLGSQYHYLENYDKALEIYNEALKIEPDNYKAYFEIAWIYWFKKDYNKYISFLQKAAKLGDVRAQKSLREKGVSW